MSPLSILFRYVSRTFLWSFAVSLACLFSIIVLFDFAEIQRRTGAKEISFLTKLNLVVLRAPHFAEQVLPFLVFIAAIYVFWRMNRSNELIIFRSTGISLWQLIIPMSVTALFIGFIDLTAFNPLATAMQSRYEKLIKKSYGQAEEDLKVSTTGLWLSERAGPNQVFYRADKLNLNELEFDELNIIVTAPGNKFLSRIDAKKAFIKDNLLELHDGWFIEAGKPAVRFSHKTIATHLDQEKIKSLKVSRGNYSFWQLPAYIRLLQTSGLNTLRYQIYWHSMLAQAFWTGAIVLLAAAFSCRPYRQGKTLLFILIGILLGFLLYFFKDMFFALGAAGSLPPIISAWLPSLITIMVGATMVFYQEDG